MEKLLSIEDKFLKIREYKGLTQDALSDILGCGTATISRCENGTGKYSAEQIKRLRKSLDLEDVPLFEDEIADFRKRLYFLRDNIRDWRIAEARKLREELTGILKVPFEPELRMLFDMFSVRLLMKDGSVDSAEECLTATKFTFDEATATDEMIYHFNYNMGSLYAYKGDYREAQKYYMKAFDIDGFVKEEGLYYNLAYCYSKLGAYVHAVNFLERMHGEFNHSSTSELAMRFENLLGTNYMRIGQMERAKELFEKSLERAKNFGIKPHIGGVLHNYGCVSLKLGEYEEALRYFEQALECLSEGSGMYFENMYFKIRCLIAMKSSMAKVLLPRVVTSAKGNEHYLLLFNSLTHLSARRNEKSLIYIEEVTIPYLLEKCEYFRVIDYCEFLEKAHRNTKIKPLEIASILRNVYQKMIFGEVSVSEKKDS
jgi:tetratricopeptide (TPR) repeat protein